MIGAIVLLRVFNRNAVFLPIPGSLAKAATAFSKSVEGNCMVLFF